MEFIGFPDEQGVVRNVIITVGCWGCHAFGYCIYQVKCGDLQALFNLRQTRMRSYVVCDSYKLERVPESKKYKPI